MKILHIETGMHLFGGARQVLYLMEGLRGRGVLSVLACPTGSAIAVAAEQAGHDVRTLPMRGDLDLPLILRLRRLLRAERPDLFHLHSRRGAGWLGGLAALGMRVPVVLSRRVDNPPARLLVPLQARLFDRIVAISAGIEKVLLATGFDPAQVVRVPSAVDVDAWRDCGDRAALEARFDLPPATPVIGIVAQLIERKGHATLLDAWPAVLRRHPEARLLIFGRGALAPALTERIARESLGDSVAMAGFVAELSPYLGALDLLVHPAALEGLGVALLEGAAAARPIVASRTGGIPEIVLDGETGLLVSPGEPVALANAVCKLLDDPATARRLGQQACAHVRAAFSIDSMVDGNLAVYRALLNR